MYDDNRKLVAEVYKLEYSFGNDFHYKYLIADVKYEDVMKLINIYNGNHMEHVTCYRLWTGTFGDIKYDDHGLPILYYAEWRGGDRGGGSIYCLGNLDSIKSHCKKHHSVIFEDHHIKQLPLHRVEDEFASEIQHRWDTASELRQKFADNNKEIQRLQKENQELGDKFETERLSYAKFMREFVG